MFLQEEKVLDYKFSKKNNTFELFASLCGSDQ